MTAEERDRVVAAIARLLAELATLPAPAGSSHYPDPANPQHGKVDPVRTAGGKAVSESGRQFRDDPGGDWPSCDESS